MLPLANVDVIVRGYGAVLSELCNVLRWRQVSSGRARLSAVQLAGTFRRNHIAVRLEIAIANGFDRNGDFIVGRFPGRGGRLWTAPFVSNPTGP